MASAATAAQLQSLLDQAVFVAHYNFRVHAVGQGECTVHVPFAPGLERPGRVVGGPVFMAAADVAMWLAVLTRLGPDDMSVTAGLNTTFLAPARGEDFDCTARVLKLGRRLIYGVAECIGRDGRLLTHHTVTYARPESSATSA